MKDKNMADQKYDAFVPVIQGDRYGSFRYIQGTARIPDLYEPAESGG